LEQTSDAVLVIGPPPEITVSACSAQLASLIGCRAEVRPKTMQCKARRWAAS
jgi:hypothetical protein